MKRKKVEKYFNDEYIKICKELYVDCTKNLKKVIGQNIDLVLFKNGTIQKKLYEYTETIFDRYKSNIIKLVTKIGEKFDKSLSDKFIKEFENLNNKNLDSYFEEIEKNIQDNIKEELKETTKIKLYNLKQNLRTNIIGEMIEENNSIKRKIKKNGLIEKIKNSIIDNFVGYLIVAFLGWIISKIFN